MVNPEPLQRTAQPPANLRMRLGPVATLVWCCGHEVSVPSSMVCACVRLGSVLKPAKGRQQGLCLCVSCPGIQPCRPAAAHSFASVRPV